MIDKLREGRKLAEVSYSYSSHVWNLDILTSGLSILRIALLQSQLILWNQLKVVKTKCLRKVQKF